jgi:hypothetical protein
MEILRKFYKARVKNHLPKPLRKSISGFMNFFRKNTTAKQFEKSLKNWNKVWYSAMFPYPWANDYKHKIFLCKKDENCDLFFAEDHGIKLYLLKEIESAQVYVASMSLEQDLFSAHRYVTKENKMWGALERDENKTLEETPFFVEKGDIVADIGASCGNFSISVIENAKHIYLFEANENWNKPLRNTKIK